jgi:CO dehydrogenase maturation factor
MSLVIAVAGKGGTGKTTFSALLVRELIRADLRPVLAVDADPNSNLAEALGVERGKTLADIREKGSGPEGSPPGGVGRIRAVEDELQRSVVEAEGFDLVTMGRPEGPRCYCAVNTLLRKTLDDLNRNYKAVVLDNEAGMEHLSRRTTTNVDFLIAVMDPTNPALRAVRRILELSRELPIQVAKRAVLLNRARAARTGDGVLEELEKIGPDVGRLPDVPQDDAVERAGADGRDVFSLDAGTAALKAVRKVVQKLSAGG